MTNICIHRHLLNDELKIKLEKGTGFKIWYTARGGHLMYEFTTNTLGMYHNASNLDNDYFCKSVEEFKELITQQALEQML